MNQMSSSPSATSDRLPSPATMSDPDERPRRDLSLWALATGLLAGTFSIYPLYDYLAPPMGVAGAITAIVALATRSGRRPYAIVGLLSGIAAVPLAIGTIVLYGVIADLVRLGLRLSPLFPEALR